MTFKRLRQSEYIYARADARDVTLWVHPCSICAYSTYNSQNQSSLMTDSQGVEMHATGAPLRWAKFPGLHQYAG